MNPSVRAGKVNAVTVRDNRAVDTLTIAFGFNLPVGVVFRDSTLYLPDEHAARFTASPTAGANRC